MKIKEAVDELIKALNEDEMYRYSWQANIAVQFQDAWQKSAENGGLPATPEQIHAVDELIKALNEDEMYRYSWQANIAVQFQDAWQKSAENGGLPATPEQIHEISNEAAINFLNMLCSR